MSFGPLSIADLRIVFVGARIVGYRTLEALLAGGGNIVGLLTLDESKEHVTTAFANFDNLIQRYRLNARKFTSLNVPEQTAWVESLRPHLGIVVGVSQLIGEEMLRLPQRGFIGMHPTMLPEGRGRAPIPWALIKDLEKTGVSWFYCDPGADTGDLLTQREVPIYYEDTSSTLGGRTDDVAIQLLLDALPGLAQGTAPRMSQDESRATIWHRRRPEDGVIDWEKEARDLYNWVRALTHPYPGAFSYYRGRRLWIWGARESLDSRTGSPGEILAVLPQGVLVATGRGSLLITKVQWEDGEEMDASQADLATGSLLGHSS